MATTISHSSCSFLLSFLAALCLSAISNGGLACKVSEKRALLSFKGRLVDSFYSLDSWNPDNDDDCCSWAGVRCSNNTGHVVGLDLSNKNLSGEISSHLLGLDLSHNEISSSIPEYLLPKTLEFLDLSSNNFSLSHLQGKTLEAFQKLCDLRVLRLNNNNISIAMDELRNNSSGCTGNKLEELDLHFSGLLGRLPDWIGGLKNLRKLDISINRLHGPIPKSLSGLTKLETLSLSTNSFDGVLTEEHLSNMTNLRFLDISFNPSLGFHVNPNWQPPFQLEEIHMSSSNVGPRFPVWLMRSEAT